MMNNSSKSKPSLSTRSGFTLIELLVVIVILAILMAIAIPTLLNQRKKAWDTSTRSDVAQVHKTMKSGYVDNQAYDVAEFGNLSSDEPNLNMVDTGDDYPLGKVKVTIPNDQVTVLSSSSKSGRKFCTISVESGANAGHTVWEEGKGPRPGDCPTIAATGVPSSGAGATSPLVVTNAPTIVEGSYPDTYSGTWSGSGATPGTSVTIGALLSPYLVSNVVLGSSVVNPDGTWTIAASYTCQQQGGAAVFPVTIGTKKAMFSAYCMGPTSYMSAGAFNMARGTGTFTCDGGPYTANGTRTCYATIAGINAPAGQEFTTLEATGITNSNITNSVVNADGTWAAVASYECPIDGSGQPTTIGSGRILATGQTVLYGPGPNPSAVQALACVSYL